MQPYHFTFTVVLTTQKSMNGSGELLSKPGECEHEEPPSPPMKFFFGNDVLDPRVVPFQAASLMECTIGGNQASRIEVCVNYLLYYGY